MPEAVTAPMSLHCRDEGTGPAVLLLHGLGGDHTMWDGQVAELAREFRVLAPDLRGHGRSAAPPGSTFSFPEMEGDLRLLLSERQIDRAHVVGISAGGFLAMRWALDDPSHVRSLMLVGSSVHCDNHTRAVAQRWAETYRDEGFDAYVLRLVKDLFYPDWIDQHLEIVEAVSAQQRPADFASVFAWGQTAKSFDLRGRLLKIKLPTRVLHGMDDAVVDGSHARLLRVSIPGADLKLFAQTGHLVPLERPAETTEAIREFVRFVESGSPPAPS